MSEISLYGSALSPYHFKVAILLHELKIKYNFIKKEYGDGPNGMKDPGYLAINPLGRIPTLVDHTHNDLIVWDSTAIIMHLAETRGASDIIGKDPKERAEIMKWVMTQVSDFSPNQYAYVYYKNVHPVKDLDASVYERYLNQIHFACGMIEKQLEKGDFIVLNRFTLADISTFPMLNLLPTEHFNIDLSKYPKVLEYLKRIRSLPSVKLAYDEFPNQPKKE